MKFYPYLPLGVSLIASLSLTSCIDDSYDLSDIDTTVKVQVNDLTVPVNIDAITMKSILNLKEDGIVREVDGVYAVIQDGTFTSEDIEISPFVIVTPDPAPASVKIPNPGNGQFPIATPMIQFTATGENVSECIIDIESATTMATIELTNSITGANSTSATIENAVYRLPKGLTATSSDGVYDPETGLFTCSAPQSFSKTITLDVSAIDLHKAGATFDAENHRIDFNTSFGIVSGTVALSSGAPAEIEVSSSFHLSEIKATSLTGVIDYRIQGVEVTNVTLDNLPDILTDENTDITILNPQIYLSIFNPLNSHNVYASSGATIISYHGDTPYATFSPEPNIFRTGVGSADGYYNFCMAPKATSFVDYPDATFVPFSSLSRVLSGNGLPSLLTVELDDPRFPNQHVAGFPLGINLGKADGRYTFLAPLAFGAGSRIVYTDHIDGWGSEDLDHMVITDLHIKAIISTDIPIDLNFTGYPIDAEGNQIDGVTIEGGVVPANAKDHELHLHITGEIHRLDGIRFSAVATDDGSDSALAPGMTITLTNIRPTVSGYYENEL